jgi:hypothetical protein
MKKRRARTSPTQPTRIRPANALGAVAGGDLGVKAPIDVATGHTSGHS